MKTKKYEPGNLYSFETNNGTLTLTPVFNKDSVPYFNLFDENAEEFLVFAHVDEKIHRMVLGFLLGNEVTLMMFSIEEVLDLVRSEFPTAVLTDLKLLDKIIYPGLFD